MALPLLPGLPVERLSEALLAGQPPPSEAQARLAAIGLSRWDVWLRLTADWRARAGPDGLDAAVLDPLLLETAAAPDPDGATLNLARLDQALGGMTLPRLLAADPRLAHDALFLLGLGTLPGETLLRDPELLNLLYERPMLEADPDPAVLTREAVAILRRHQDRDRRRSALRQWKRQQFLRIIARDYLLHRPAPVITREISAVADACVRASLAAALADRGIPTGDDGQVSGLAIIALGKWGSQELNYNSDIDLLCVRMPTRDGLDGQQWSEIVAGVARDIGEQTAEGQVFRVDFRLRPDGVCGVLVPTLDACSQYYQTRGAAWEAQMLTRARFAAGDRQLGEAFETLARQVAYGARVSLGGIAEIRRNRQRIGERADAAQDIKESRGGIRDIEFTVQLLQLVRGVTDPTVRQGNTWAALDALVEAGALSDLEGRRLSEAYSFLRRVEHSLQIQPAAPTRQLPTAESAQRILARGLHCRDGWSQTAADRFLDEFQSHTATVRELCDRLFFNPIPLADGDSAARIQELLDPHISDAEAARHLAEIPFRNPGEARRRLIFLAHGEPPLRLPQAIQAAFVQVLPALLSVVQRMPDPDGALLWLQRFVARTGGRQGLYRFLLDHPPALELLGRIGGFSDTLAETIVDHPELLDQVVDPRFLEAQPTREEYAGQLASRLRRLASPEARLNDLRRWRRREIFRTGVQDLIGTRPAEEIMASLTAIAETCLGQLLAEARLAVPGGADLPFAILGGGKLGGAELHYSSDLDILFVYDSDRPDAATIAEQLAQWLTREAERRGAAGALYPIDTRLRPGGVNSVLARTPRGYRNYYGRHGQVWERLALSRVRAVAGDPNVGQTFEELARELAYAVPFDETALAALRQTRARMETERPGDPSQQLDVKLDVGGIRELEYLTQILQLQHLSPTTCQQGTREALTALHAAGVLDLSEFETLTRCYSQLRRFELRLQLVAEDSGGLISMASEKLAAAAKQLGWGLSEAHERPAQLLADLRQVMARVAEIYDRRIGRATA